MKLLPDRHRNMGPVLVVSACVSLMCASPTAPPASSRGDFSLCLQLIQRNYLEEVDLDAHYRSTLHALVQDFELELRQADEETRVAQCAGRSAWVPARISSAAELLDAEAAVSELLAVGCHSDVPLWRRIPPSRAFTYRFIESLDPSSRYLAPELVEDLEDHGTSGVGIAFAESAGGVVVTEVYPGTPANHAGLRAGDRIVSIDGNPIEGLPLGEVALLLRGPDGSPIELTVLGEGDGGAREESLRREQVRYAPVEAPVWWGNVAYVRIRTFQRETPEALEAVLKTTALASGLILDVRSNSGGLLDAVVEGVDLFVLEGAPIGQVIARNPREARRFIGSSKLIPTPSRILVLVDRHTAAGAELFAEALRDAGLATLVGERTLGRSSIQTVYPLEPGSGLKITTGVLVAGARGPIPRRGLAPDVEVADYEGGVPTADRDPVLRAAFSAL